MPIATAQPRARSGQDIRSLGTLLAHYKAETASNLYANGDGVGNWLDDSKNARTLVQATANKKPLLVTNSQNGLPVVRFNGTSSYMETATFAITQPVTIFLAVRIISISTYGYLVDGKSANTMLVRAIAGNALGLYAGASLDTGSGITPGTFQIIKVVFNGGSSASFIDGVSMASGNAGTGTVDGLTVGVGGSVGGYYANMDLGELAVFKGAMSTYRSKRVEQILSNKWGISITL